MLLSLASAAQPPQCSGQRLLASWPCSANLTIHCGPEGNEQCVATIADCSALLSCAPPNHVRCADGTCTSSAGNCIAAAAPCGVGVLCADGSCGSTAAACTAVPGCPTSAPTRCADGSCATVSSGCATLYPCAPAMERCADGQCALRHRCPPTDGCTLALPQRCADGRCYAAGADCALGCAAGEGGSARLRCHDGTCAPTAADCTAPLWQSKPPRFSVRLPALGANSTSTLLGMAGLGSVSVPSGAFATETRLTVSPLADSAVARAQAPASWADWQRSLFSPALVLAAHAPAAGGELSTPVPALPLVISLRATLPGGVAEADACLGELLQLDESRRLWRCVPGATLSGALVSAAAFGSSSGSTYELTSSVARVGTYAIIFSSSAGSPHPNLADVHAPPPPPPDGGGGGCSAAPLPSPPATPTPAPPAAPAPAGFGGIVAAFSCLVLMAAAAIGAYQLLCAGSPLQFHKEEEEDPDGVASNTRVHPLMPGMPGYAGE